MNEIKRRGFVAGLGAFFGAGGAALARHPDAAQPVTVPAVVADTPLPPSSRPVGLGDIIELGFGDMTTKAVVMQSTWELAVDVEDIHSALHGPIEHRTPTLEITLRLRAVAPPTVAG